MTQTESKTVLEMEESEIQERVNLLRRLRSMLELQRNKFRSYLGVLEQQEASIKNGDNSSLEAQTKLEQQLVREILAVQKVVKPLDAMYAKMYPNKKEEITNLQYSLNQLREQVLERNELNRMLLGKQRDALKEKIAALRIPKGRKSVYAKSGGAGLIDISA